jgi:hypothetical protein
MTLTKTPTWWTEPFRMYQTNLREVDSDLDVDAALRTIEAHGANVWLIGAGGIVSHYPTDLPFQTPSARLAGRESGDLVGDALAAAHARDIKLIARFDFSKIDVAVAQQHPEWVFVDSDGEWQTYNGLVSTCPAAGYYQDAAFTVLREFFERYPVDGLFFNMFLFPVFDYSYRWRGACFCETCKREFSRHSGGLDLPTSPDSPSNAAWLAWSGQVVSDLVVRFRDLAYEVAPQAAFLSGPESAVAFHEANNAVGREFWPFETSQAVSELRSRADAKPVVVNSVAFLDMVYRFAAEEPERFAQYAIQTLSRGGNPSVYIMGAPGGAVEYESVTAVSDIFAFHRDASENYRDTRPAARIALVREHPSLVQFLAAAFLGGAKKSTHEAEYRGWYRALQQLHHPFDVVRVNDVAPLEDAGDLSRYSILIVPELGELPADTAAALQAYAEAGGTVIVTGASGFDAEGPQFAALPATELTTTITDTETLRNSYAGPAQPHETTCGPYAGPLLPIIGGHTLATWREGVTMHGQIVSAAPFGPPEKCYGNSPLDEPAYVVGTAGRGQVVQVPWTVGASYTASSMRVVRDLMGEIVGQALGEADVRTDLPEQVEITLLRNRFGLLLHVVNHTGIDVGGYAAPVPLSGYSLSIRCTDEVTGARALLAGIDLEVTTNGDLVLIDLPEVHRYDVIQLTTSAPQG